MTKWIDNKLERNWAFWLVILDYSESDTRYTIETICNIKSFQEFHDSFLKLPKISDIKRKIYARKYASIGFFEEGILPAWEDDKNKNGGAYKFQIRSENIDVVWRDLLICACGNMLDKHNNENKICGLMVSPKKEQFAYDVSIWVAEDKKDQNLIKYICELKALKNILKPEDINYSKHFS